MVVRNESRHLEEVVDSILGQDYPGCIELAIAVGPSRDGTEAVAERIAATSERVTVVMNPSGRTPAGLNRAIACTSAPVVARADGHALLPQGYLRRAVEILEQTGAVNVGGVMAAEGTTAFQRAVAAAMSSPFGVGGGRFHYGGEPGPADTVYLGVFRRSALVRVGGYDEGFSRAQDWEMNYRIRATGGLVWFAPSLRVSYRPRGSLVKLARQYFNYGRWRREVMRRHPESVNLRYLAPPLALLGFLAGLGAGTAGFWPGYALPIGYVAAVVAGALVEGRGLPIRAKLALPAVFAVMHMSWGLGFLTSLRRKAA
jgi:glycosyltransferase involved in cell wall biosynthesis